MQSSRPETIKSISDASNGLARNEFQASCLERPSGIVGHIKAPQKFYLVRP